MVRSKECFWIRQRGFTANRVVFVSRGLKDAGYGAISVDDILKLRSHGLNPGFLRQVKAVGYRGFVSLELFNRDYWKQDPHQVAKTGLEKTKAVVRSAGSTSRNSGIPMSPAYARSSAANRPGQGAGPTRIGDDGPLVQITPAAPPSRP